jgi:hypothetical protein
MNVVFKNRMDFRRSHGNQNKLEMQRIICDRNVVLTERIVQRGIPAEDLNQGLVRFSVLMADWLRVNNDERLVEANGSTGHAGFLERNKSASTASTEQLPFARTDIKFTGKMTYNHARRSAVFTKDCWVLRSPIAHVRELPDEGNMRPEAVLVLADKISLFERQEGTRKNFDFHADDRVRIVSRQYEGFGDHAQYDQENDRLLLQGNRAVLKKTGASGQEGEETSAEELEYFVKANHVKVRNVGRMPAFDVNQARQGLPASGKRNR